MSYHHGLGFALKENIQPITLEPSKSTSMDAPSLEEVSCMKFQRALAEVGLYHGVIDGDVFRVADIRNALRSEHGFPLVAGNTSITHADFEALKMEVEAMTQGEGPPPAIIPDKPASGEVVVPNVTPVLVPMSAPSKTSWLVPAGIVAALAVFFS